MWVSRYKCVKGTKATYTLVKEEVNNMARSGYINSIKSDMRDVFRLNQSQIY